MLGKLGRLLVLILLVGVFYIGLTQESRPAPDDGRVHIAYWEKWTGFEGEAMRAVVDEFNCRQDRIFVDVLAISQVNQKVLLAAAGGVPPDVAGMWDNNISAFADKHALMPLDDYLERAGITRDHYIPCYWDVCEYKGHMYALPSAPHSVGIHWNKGMFREAGLDPDRPPRTLEELDAYAAQLTERDEDGRLVQMGFMPSYPGWWNWAWGYWLGGALWDGEDTITADSPENIRAFEWVQSYSEKYGTGDLQVFQSGFGNWSSPQDAFLSGRVAIVLQGVWLGNYIDRYAPDMEWGAAPWPHPAGRPDLAEVSPVASDILCIPAGAKHPDEAFEFIAFVNSQEGMELLNMGQRKHSPLAEVSDEFISEHPNPYIQVFIDVAKKSRAFGSPKMPIWAEYGNEMAAAFDSIWLQQATPQEALEQVTARMQPKLDRALLEAARREGRS